MKIDTNAAWRLYTQQIPAGSQAIGTVSRGGGDVGALVRMPTGIYVQLNGGCIRSLDQRQVADALRRASA